MHIYIVYRILHTPCATTPHNLNQYFRANDKWKIAINHGHREATNVRIFLFQKYGLEQ